MTYEGTNTCCFLGHREINKVEKLKQPILEIVERLILSYNVDTFFFGSKSSFNSLCLEAVTEIKEKYPHIKRIYIRAEYPYINEDYKTWLLKHYEDTYYPKHIIGAGRVAYVERNYEMINKSRFCVVYYEEKYSPKNRKSGTKIALDYAIKKNKEIIILSV